MPACSAPIEVWCGAIWSATTGYSRAQLTRLVQRWLDDPRLAKRYRKSGMSFEALDAYAAATSDNKAAHQMNEARTQMFQTIYKRSRKAA